MTQGRKSRTVLALVCALAALTAAALAPAFASGQAAENEYNLTLPGAGGGHGGGAGGGQSPGTVGTSSGSSGGGAPILLIALAAVAAIGTGAAVWRLRDRSSGGSGKVGPGAPEAASETQ